MCICTGDEAGSHGEDCTCVGVVETFGVLLIYLEISVVCE